MEVRIAIVIRTTFDVPHAQDRDDCMTDTYLKAVPIIDRADEDGSLLTRLNRSEYTLYPTRTPDGYPTFHSFFEASKSARPYTGILGSRQASRFPRDSAAPTPRQQPFIGFFWSHCLLVAHSYVSQRPLCSILSIFEWTRQVQGRELTGCPRCRSAS